MRCSLTLLLLLAACTGPAASPADAPVEEGFTPAADDGVDGETPSVRDACLEECGDDTVCEAACPEDETEDAPAPEAAPEEPGE